MEWHGAIAIYVIGTLALIISAVHTAVTSQEKGILMNGFELEKNLDEKKYRQVKTLLLALQCFLLILYVVLFILILIPFNYRIFNTLDAMVGYKTDELIDIGFVPAKIDDILNYIPSRIAGLFVVLSAFCLNFDYKNSYKILKRDARNCPSPNSGFTMASAAGALNIQLIKLDTYILGDNNKNIETSDIGRAVKLSKLAIFLFTVTIILFIFILYVIL